MKHVSPATTHSKWHAGLLLSSVSMDTHPSPINGRVQILTVNILKFKGGVGHRGGVTTTSDNQFRTLVLLERSLFGLRPQRLLSNNTVFFTNYLILKLHRVYVSCFLYLYMSWTRFLFILLYPHRQDELGVSECWTLVRSGRGDGHQL